jgi:hypothetical protein
MAWSVFLPRCSRPHEPEPRSCQWFRENSVQSFCRKEVIIVKYEKPEVVVLGSALDAVKIMEKDQAGVKDSTLGEGFTADAYEADE